MAERDKVRELAEKIWDGRHRDIESILRAELQPLLDAAEESTENCGDHCRNSCCHCWLAAELQGWRKDEKC